MKTVFTRVTSLLLAIVLLLALAGCSNSGGSTPGAEGQETTIPTLGNEAGPSSPPDPFAEETTEPDSIEMPDPTSPIPDTEPATEPNGEQTPEAISPSTEPSAVEPSEPTPPETEPPSETPAGSDAVNPTEITEPSTGSQSSINTNLDLDALVGNTGTSHSHSYSAVKTVSPTCESRGYTTYKCACGSSYKDNYTAALGHRYSAAGKTAASCESGGYTTYKCTCGDSYKADHTQATGHRWSNWVTTKEPTTQAEGQKTRTCSGCGKNETQSIAKKEAEVIDLAVLEEYGRQYGATTFGYEAYVGIRAGYFPAYFCIIDSMEKGYSEVEACVDDTTNALIAAGYQIYQEIEGHIGRIRLDVDVVHERDNVYYVTVYYG